ncbi:MAG: hypothetical protein JWQ57_2478, partial [Mucilaginibacter sp.]|nr:hypothetical protein [Mucilaginibacter sp.]
VVVGDNTNNGGNNGKETQSWFAIVFDIPLLLHFNL